MRPWIGPKNPFTTTKMIRGMRGLRNNSYDEQWNNTLHRLIHVAGIYLNPTFSYSYGFLFDVEVMDGFFICVWKMVPSLAECAGISEEMEIYRMAGGTFSFDMAIVDRKSKMPSKI